MKKCSIIFYKVMVILCLSCMLSFLLVTPATASDTGKSSGTIDSAISGAQSFVNDGKNGKETIKQKPLQEASNMLFNILLIGAVAVAVIWAGMLGIKFITGSVEEKADFKEQLIPFIVGCCVAFGAFGIWKVITNILMNIEG